LERIKNGHFDEFKQEYLDYVSTNLDSSKDEFIKRKLSVNPVSTGSINNFI